MNAPSRMLDVVIVDGGNWITHDQILPSCIIAAFWATSATSYLCAQLGRRCASWRRAPSYRPNAFPGQTFQAHPALDEPRTPCTPTFSGSRGCACPRGTWSW